MERHSPRPAVTVDVVLPPNVKATKRLRNDSRAVLLDDLLTLMRPHLPSESGSRP
jgi:hypothetical protein